MTRNTALAACMTLIASPSVWANNVISQYSDHKYALRISTGFLNGTSGEYVYDADGSDSGIPGYKVSELNWDLNDVLMLNIGGSVQLNDKFSLNLEYAVNAGDGDGTMDDYDWLYVGAPWSHWSHHDNTTVEEVSSIDISTVYNFSSKGGDNNKSTQVGAIAGFRRDRLSWYSVGGYGIYSDTDNNKFRNQYIIFDDVKVISYEQEFQAPYVGLSLTSRGRSGNTPIIFRGRVRYSPYTFGEDVDIHHLRNLRFEESGDGGTWLGWDFALDFELSRRFDFTFGYSTQKYTEIKSDTLITNIVTGATSYYGGDAAGLDHTSSQTSIGMSYRF